VVISAGILVNIYFKFGENLSNPANPCPVDLSRDCKKYHSARPVQKTDDWFLQPVDEQVT
jgi:hypothetical protein